MRLLIVDDIIDDLDVVVLSAREVLLLQVTLDHDRVCDGFFQAGTLKTRVVDFMFVAQWAFFSVFYKRLEWWRHLSSLAH